MDKFSKSNELNVTLSGGKLTHPIRPTVMLGPKKEGFPVGQLVDANAVRLLTDPIEYDITELEEAVDALKTSTRTINSKIPSEASPTNQLADKSFVQNADSQILSDVADTYMPLGGTLMGKTFKLKSEDGSSKVEAEKTCKFTVDLIKNQQSAGLQVSTDAIWINRRKDGIKADKIICALNEDSSASDIEDVTDNGSGATFGGDVTAVVGHDKVNIVGGSAYVNAVTKLALRCNSTTMVGGRSVDVVAMPADGSDPDHILLQVTPTEGDWDNADGDSCYMNLGLDGFKINVPGGDNSTGGVIESSNSVLRINTYEKVKIEVPLESVTIDEIERVTAEALCDLNTRVSNLEDSIAQLTTQIQSLQQSILS